VDERVIVPRSFIAELLKVELHPWVTDRDAIGSVLDLCTGSGCLAILAALALPHAAIDATDVSADALGVARRNVTDYRLEGRIRLVECDMFSGLENKRYDLILANPPYVGADSMTTLPPEYRHEPRRALAGGADGLDAIKIILREAYGHLREGGLLIVEVGRNREALEAAFPRLPFVWLDTSSSEDYVFLLRRENLG
jgi:ribosomal protein L3 glutamine methyltransferase